MPVGRLFIDIGGDTSKLNESLRQAIETAKDAGVKVQAAGKSMIAAFDQALNPTKALGEQLKLLQLAGKSNADIWTVYGDKLKAASDAAAKHGQAIDPLVKKQLEFGKSLESSKFSVDSLGRTLQDFARNPIQATQSALTGFIATLGPTAIAIGAVGSAVGIAGAALVKLGAQAADEAENLENLSVSTGLTTQKLQALAEIGKEAGLEGLDLGRTIGKLNEQLGSKEGGDFTRALVSAGIALEDSGGKAKDAVTLLDELRNTFIRIEDPVQRAQAAQAALGGRLRDLIPLLLNSNMALADQIKIQEAAGPVWDDITQKKLLAFDNALDKIGRTWRGLVTDIKAGVGAMLGSISEFASGAGAELDKLSAEQLVKMNLEVNGGIKPDFSGIKDPFSSVNVDSLKQADVILRDVFVAQQKLIAQNADNLDLRLKISEAEKEFERLVNKGTNEQVAAQAQIIKGLNEQLKARKETEEAAKRLAKEEEALDERMKRMEWGILSARIEATAQNYRDVAKAAAASNTELIRNAEAIDKAKKTYEDLEPIPIKLDWELPEELPVTKAIKEAAAEAQKSIDALRDDAGSIFDAMVASGKHGFTSLLDWIEGFWMTKLRTLFQNFIQYLSGGMQGGLGSILTGVINVGSRNTASVSGGLMSYASSLGLTASEAAAATGSGMGATAGLFGLSATAWTGIGAAISGLAIAIPSLVKAIQGMNSYEATSKEVSRDFGGIKMSDADVKSWMDSVGLNENEVWSKRQNMKTSPSFLLEAWETAQSQGREQDFLRSLENVGTSWGEFNFRDAFELGRLTDDWSKLNEIWLETSKLGEAFKNMPDVLENMLIDPEDLNPYEDLVRNLNDLKKSIKETLPSTEDMYKTFLDTGVVTGELAARIKELGGSVADFEAVSELTKVSNEWGELVQHWRDTGEILPRLIDLYGQFGGSMSALNDAAQLKGLKDSLGFITSLTSQLQSQLKSPIELLMSGSMNADVIAALSGAGLDPGRFTNLTSIINAKNAFSSANFQPFQELTPSLQKYLSEYGGQAGKTAVANYGNGFNTITQGLLDSTAAAIQEKYQAEIKSLLEYLGDSADSTTSAIETLTASVEEQFKTVGDSITTALNAAKEDLITALDGIINTAIDRMIAFENDIVYDARVTPSTENPNTVATIGPDGPITTGQMNLAEWQSIVQNMIDQGAPENLIQEWIAHNPMPQLATGGVVTKTGMAIVDKGEVFSGVGRGFNNEFHFHFEGAHINSGEDVDNLFIKAIDRLHRRGYAFA